MSYGTGIGESLFKEQKKQESISTPLKEFQESLENKEEKEEENGYVSKIVSSVHKST